MVYVARWKLFVICSLIDVSGSGGCSRSVRRPAVHPLLCPLSFSATQIVKIYVHWKKALINCRLTNYCRFTDNIVSASTTGVLLLVCFVYLLMLL